LADLSPQNDGDMAPFEVRDHCDDREPTVWRIRSLSSRHTHACTAGRRQQYFRVSAPSVHQMVFTLERK
jgi:hypothetical protein